VLLLAVLALLACSPALNWREVPLNRLTALLPCKPDRAQRTVHLGSQALQMDMAGCEAAGGLFAISHLRLSAPGQAAQVLADWRAGTLRSMHSTAVTELPWRPVAGAGAPALPPVLLEATGKGADGTVVQARLAWLVDGVDLFLLAVYAPRLTADMTETLFSELKLQ
jgi:hypothetical protein